jgi:hypothetical protein
MPYPGCWEIGPYGPPGTVWLYDIGRLRDRLTQLGVNATYKAALNYLVRQVEEAGLPPEHTQSWTNPGVLPALPDLGRYSVMSVKALRTTIHAKLGTEEEVAHVLHWITAPTPGAALDLAAVKAFGDKVRDTWQAFFTGASGEQNTAIAEYFSADLQYDEVRTSYVNIPAAPGKETYDVLTQHSPFTAGACVGRATSQTLPYETALAVSLGTNFRDRRARGRTYMGGLGANMLATHGKFDVARAGHVGEKFGSAFVNVMNSTSIADLHIVSRKYATTAPVQGIRIGVVPDSQRRRRRSQVEGYTLVWGQAVGAV